MKLSSPLPRFGLLLGALTLTSGPFLFAPVHAQAAANKAAKSEEVTPAEQKTFDKFLDDHPEIADDLIQNPGRADSKEFLEHHPLYKEFIAKHAKLAAAIKEHPDQFVDNFLKREDDTDITKGQAKEFAGFLKDHPTDEHDLVADPKLLKDAKFLADHKELHEFLEKHHAIAGFAEAKPVRLMVRAEIFLGKRPKP